MKTNSLLRSVLVLTAGWLTGAIHGATPPVAGDLEWPTITSQNKPWSRWWWLGNIGTKQDFTSEMEKYAKAGLGGLEITPIYGVRGQEDRFTPYLSRAWMEQFDHVLSEGERLGLGIDMSTGTGWPFGGPWVPPADAARSVVTKTFTVKGGARLVEPVTATDEPLVRPVDPRSTTKITDLKDPITANANLQELALDQVRFPRKLPLQALVAQSDTKEKINLTDKVGADGKLDWVAPGTGNWTLYAVFLGWHGKQVERAGPGGEGDVIDHFSREPLMRYLKKFDEAYTGFRANRLRAYFNDSYEVDDASGESNWTGKFFEEFQRRRGYDLRMELPAFFGQDTPEKNARVMSDHRETISDLLLEEFTIPWANWAKTHGGIIRNQAHGSPANLIDLYAASDIPETEGATISGMKMASSAAHLTGKLLTSAETATWLDEHWVSTLGDIKRRVDLMFLGGVNHNCYHGTVFSPPGEPWPGHHFYAAVELDPSNSIWTDFDVLNRYVARAQSFLQSGRPANDILLYHPIYDAWAVRGNGAMPHYSQSGQRGVTGQGIAQDLLNRGYTFDYISDRLLAKVEFKDGALTAGGNRYSVVVVPETKFMPLDTFYHLYRLAELGATVVFHKALPDDVPGLGRLLGRRTEFQVYTETFRRGITEPDGLGLLTWNKGRLMKSDKLEQLLDRAQVKREALVDRGLQFERRAHGKGHLYFLVNSAEQRFTGWAPLATPATAAALFDPMTGQRGLGALRASANGAEVYLDLAPGETIIVKTFATELLSAPAYAYAVPAGDARTLSGPWEVRFASGGPTLPAATRITALGSWTDFGPDALKAFSGTAVYTLRFNSVAGAPDAWLDLGRVADSARVTLNGRGVGELIDAPWRVTIPRALLRAGENVLEVAVTNLAANRIADLDRRDPSWKKFYNTNYPARIATNRGPDGQFSAAKWAPRPSGLLGPVTLTPIRAHAPR